MTNDERTNMTNVNANEDGYVTITPEIAQLWLSQNVANRRIREKFVTQLAKKIKEGKWQDTTDHIGFYEDGTLANGQHRLMAISRAGIPVKAKVDYNIPKSAAICIDTGNRRSFCDNIAIVTGDSYYTSRISKMICGSFIDGRNLSYEDHLEISKVYEHEIKFIKELFSGGGRYFNQSYILSAAFTALLDGADVDKLADFADILISGKANLGSDQTVLRFRDKILKEYADMRRPRHNYAVDMKRAQNVIYAFLNDKILHQIRFVDEYRFPLRRWHIEENK